MPSAVQPRRPKRIHRATVASTTATSSDSYGLAYLQGSLNQGGLHHKMQFGADSEYRRIFRSDLLRQATRTVFSYTNPVYGTEQPSATVSASDSDQSDQLHNNSLFIQDSIYVNDKWIVALAGRYQRYNQLADTVADGCSRPYTGFR